MGARRQERDRGSLSIFVAICAVGLVVVIGIVLDCGGRLRAIERADALAQEAARAGGEQVDAAAVLSGKAVVVDPKAAETAALKYLAENGAKSKEPPQVIDGGKTLVVTVDETYHTALLGVIGIGSMTVHGEGKASLVHGVEGVENG